MKPRKLKFTIKVPDCTSLVKRPINLGGRSAGNLAGNGTVGVAVVKGGSSGEYPPGETG